MDSNIDPRLQSNNSNMRDSHERSTVEDGNSSSDAMHDLATITHAHLDPNSSEAQAALRHFQTTDPERYKQVLNTIPGAINPGHPNLPPPNGHLSIFPHHPHHPPPHLLDNNHHGDNEHQEHSVPPSDSPSDDAAVEAAVGGVPGPSSSGDGGPGSPAPTKAGRKKRSETSAEDWTRIRKDNHKEVERRRRGTINQGINELGMIVPNTNGGEKAKGAVLSRAVHYIRQLKENEARNIEKWTLEKLLMDQAISDIQAQAEDMRRRWEEERARVKILESELADARAALAAASEGSGGESASSPKEEVGQKRPRVE